MQDLFGQPSGSQGWDYEKRSAEVDAERLHHFAQNRPLAVQAKPQLQDARATAAQLELFELVGKSGYEFVEQLIRGLPSLRQREHFRKLFLREYHSVEDDGSISFQCGQKQLRHANTFLRELLEKRLGKVFAQYQFDLQWLSMSLAEKWEWALEQGMQYRDEHYRTVVGAFDDVEREREKCNEKHRLPFYLMTEAKLKVIADHLATIFSKYQTDFFTEQATLAQGRVLSEDEGNDLIETLYRRCGVLCETIGLPLPYWATFSEQDGDDDFSPNTKSMVIGLNKIGCEKYWLKALQKAQRQMVEHLAIACGEVRKGVAAYISDNGFRAWKAQRKKNFDFLNQMILHNVDDEEEQVELLEMYKRSSANPSVRHHEMMNCLNGLEVWAEENEHEALFLTLTAPSAYHAQLEKGGQNPKWNGASPKKTQSYLNKVWGQYRALLKKRAIKFYGMRVAEPHHDGTPHWHLLMYVAKEHVDEVSELFRKKALEQDGDERGAKEHRCKVEKCDKAKGSATAYIVKYISKNLGGKAALDYCSDEVEGLSFKDNASRVRAWASCWGIRQFQFYGVSSIGVWRELRRLMKGQCTDQMVETVRIGADLSDYAFYLDKQGGGGALRSEWLVKLAYEETEVNSYGEVGKRIVGVRNNLNPLGDWIKTRFKTWVAKLKPKGVTNASRSEAQETGQRPAWTCVSNCNPMNSKGSENDTVERLDNFMYQHQPRVERLKIAMKWREINPDLFEKHHIFSLINGGEVKLLGDDYISFDGNEVQISRKGFWH